jgi:hypothetical protein
MLYIRVTGSTIERGITVQEPSITLPAVCSLSPQSDIAVKRGV